MPALPAFLAAATERRGHRVVVERVERLSKWFVRLHLAGDGLRGHRWEPCQVTSFRVTPTEFRHYTPDGFDSDVGTMSILFYRHGADPDGTLPPGEAWLEQITEGSSVIAIPPAATRAFRAHRAGTGSMSYLVFGDSTTVGLWDSLIRWLPPAANVTGAVEVLPSDVALVKELLPGIDVLTSEVPGEALVGWLDQADLAGARRPDHVYLSGHGQTIQRLRHTLRTRDGVPRRAIHTQPYWATGKRGL
jgi:NADPH-dependent ferric siderophore reductase